MMRNYHLRFRRVGLISELFISWVFIGLVRQVRLYGRPFVRAKKKKYIFFVGWPFCFVRGPLEGLK